MAAIYDLVVVGAGIHGSCAAYFARKQGLNVLLLEKFTLPHSRGSSVGHSRITRRAYVQSYYANMMNQAYELWDTLEQTFAKRLFIKTGLLIAVTSGSNDELGLQHSFESNKYEYKKYTAAEVRHIYPQIAPDERDATKNFFWDPHAGVLLANQCLAAVQSGFLAAGGVLRDGEAVCRVEQQPDGSVRVGTLSGNQYNAKKAILVPGAWAKQLFASTGLVVPVEPRKILVMYWKVRESGSTAFQPAKWPALIWKDYWLSGKQQKVHFFGTPELEYPGCVKICIEMGVPVNPEERDRRTAGCDDERELVSFTCDMIGRHLPGLDNSAPCVVESCMYSMTPDSDFIIDRHPLMSNVVVASCCSGHGFKMAPLIGKLLLQLATDQQPCCDLAPFRLSRFAHSG